MKQTYTCGDFLSCMQIGDSHSTRSVDNIRLAEFKRSQVQQPVRQSLLHEGYILTDPFPSLEGRTLNYKPGGFAGNQPSMYIILRSYKPLKHMDNAHSIRRLLLDPMLSIPKVSLQTYRLGPLVEEQLYRGTTVLKHLVAPLVMGRGLSRYFIALCLSLGMVRRVKTR